ncbi:DUF1178 family protein [Erythrobacter arachoides]|uniref:DUF1178 family protein n=1 Tax=Aurantiacibacter arachoides TaxID=1850444 RepID=A0A844ZY94_9SPHN|nr:DUF1178 family protein [Aurantiacibacter arachoides]MXO93113.1 DUF1178 family protein [Aurantiacibacter arachoides]GGD51924.1 hypothetical protein GCM10011411_09720 [Aurantiacibacter arachoides]
MIVYDLCCAHDHRFEGWFGSSADFDSQKARGLLACPTCGSERIGKAPMAPAVGRKGNRQEVRAPDVHKPAATVSDTSIANVPIPPQVAQAMAKLAEAQATALKNSTWVGKEFAEQSRAMHYGERDHAAIHGQASSEDTRALLEEGVPVAPLPFPVAPPKDLN